jgi:AcrR family transcriptional regulator
VGEKRGALRRREESAGLRRIVDERGQRRTQVAMKQNPRMRRSAQGVIERVSGADPDPRPWGRQAVMEAVLDAATELFATRGPAAVTVRDIAAAAGVNHALVHRHFGTKQAVLQAVLERAAYESASVVAEITDSKEGMARIFAAGVEHAPSLRTLTRAILDGEDPHTLQRDFPTLRRMIELLQAEQRQSRKHADQRLPFSPLDARVVIGTSWALLLGWLVFEPFLLAATTLDQYDREEVRRQVVLTLQAMVKRAR